MLASSSPSSVSNTEDVQVADDDQNSTSVQSLNDDELSAEESLVLAQLDSAMLTARRQSIEAYNEQQNDEVETESAASAIMVELDARTRHQLEEAGPRRRLGRSRSVTRSLLTLFLSQMSVAADRAEADSEAAAGSAQASPDEAKYDSTDGRGSFGIAPSDCKEFNF